MWDFRQFNFLNYLIYAIVNPVMWEKEGNVIQYLQNSTFYNESRMEQVQNNLRGYFKNTRKFMNEKCVMLWEINKIRNSEVGVSQQI